MEDFIDRQESMDVTRLKPFSFCIRAKADAEVFVETSEESLPNPQLEQPRAKEHAGDLAGTKRRILARYAEPDLRV